MKNLYLKNNEWKGLMNAFAIYKKSLEDITNW